jgi:hypothetical protein
VALALLWLFACTVPRPELSRPASAPEPTTGAATPPPARGPTEEKLYQELYAGEFGEAAHAAGQRVRMLAWLDALALDASQLRGLATLAEAARAADAKVRADREAFGAREIAAYAPIYAELEARLARPDPLPEAEAQAFADRLGAARSSLLADEDPRATHYDAVRATILLSSPWIATLSDTQRDALAQCRFVLGRRLGPFVAPGDYGNLVGTMWDGGDFGTLRATLRPSDEGHLDLGGLWSVEAMQSGPDRHIKGFQVQAILLMALLEPELPAAIAERLAGEPVADTVAP